MKRLITILHSYNYDERRLTNNTRWVCGAVIYLLIFILCIVTVAVPLQRWANVPIIAQIPISQLIIRIGAWLPSEFPMLKGSHDSVIITSNGEFLLLIFLAFLFYALFARFIYLKMKPGSNNVYLLPIIVVGIIIVGLIFVFTPALLSLDVLTYADYGHTTLVYHSNPYFIPPLVASPHDPITRIDGWHFGVSAYGPLWLYICMFIALLSATDPLHYILAFRILGLFAHLLNTLLVICILRATGRSQRYVALGALLYGLNPLVLLESCLEAHNDVVMCTFMLLGICLALQVEYKECIRPKRYILPLLALTMATLIKFTSAPLLIFFIFLLFCKILQPLEVDIYPFSKKNAQRWVYGMLQACVAGLLCIFVILLFYSPFWIGHTVSAIVRSFSMTPSSYNAENSIMRMFVEYKKRHGFPSHGPWTYRLVHLLSSRVTWDTINIAVLLIMLLVGFLLLWHTPTIQNMIFTTLIVFESVLLITPWFYSWYVLWIIPLAVILLVGFASYRNRPFILFAFVFSATAFFTYIMPYYLYPFDNWRAALANGLPLATSLIFLVYHIFRRRRLMIQASLCKK